MILTHESSHSPIVSTYILTKRRMQKLCLQSSHPTFSQFMCVWNLFVKIKIKSLNCPNVLIYITTSIWIGFPVDARCRFNDDTDIETTSCVHRLWLVTWTSANENYIRWFSQNIYGEVNVYLLGHKLCCFTPPQIFYCLLKSFYAWIVGADGLLFFFCM